MNLWRSATVLSSGEWQFHYKYHLVTICPIGGDAVAISSLWKVNPSKL